MLQAVTRSLLLMSCGLSCAVAQVTPAANEIQQAHFAAKVVMIELAHGLSASVRREREKCSYACRGGEAALEIAVGSIGVNKSASAADAMVNLLALRLDAGGAEDLNCQVLIRGRRLSQRMAKLDTKQAIKRCQTEFTELRKRELAEVLDVNVAQVCRSEVELQNLRDRLLKAMKSGVMCQQ